MSDSTHQPGPGGPLDDIEIVLHPPGTRPNDTVRLAPSVPSPSPVGAPSPVPPGSPAQFAPSSTDRGAPPAAASPTFPAPPSAVPYPAAPAALAGGPAHAPTGAHPLWWLSLVAAAVVAAGVFLPFIDGGESVLIDGGWQAAAPLLCAGLMIIGGLLALKEQRWFALAGGAGLTFVGMAATVLRPLIELVATADGFVDPGGGLAAWCLGIVAAAVLGVVALTQLRGERGPTWAFAVSAGGLGLFWVGLLVPPEGLSLGDYLFFGDTWTDAAVVVLLSSIPVAVAGLATRTVAAARLALGVSGPWVISWLVFAVDGSSGGLPVPFPDTVALGALAVCLLSVASFGALWSPATAAGAATAGGAGLAGGQLVAVIICAGGVLAATVGAATADDGVGGGLLTGQGSGSPVEVDDSLSGDSAADPSIDELDSDLADLPPPPEPDPVDPPTIEPSPAGVTECVDIMCQPTIGSWVVSLGSYFSRADALAAFADLPATGVLNTNDYASLNPDIWMVFYDGGYSTGRQAVRYCFEVGRTTRDACFARRLSNDASLDPNDPSLIVFPD